MTEIEIRDAVEMDAAQAWRCTVTSTATARRFHLANGYEEARPARHNFGTTSGFPMQKLLK